jgi:diadenosine tetraphosphatase ApaH/serine/threonine PP2A family protein phosphatase
VRVAALYDIHGNAPALDAVLAEIGDDVDIVVGGDFVGPQPTIERLKALGSRVHFIGGNGERELVRPSPPREGGPPPEVLDWMRKRLSAEETEFISSLPLTVTIGVDGLGPVLFCHATPRSDEEILTAISPDDRWCGVLDEVAERTVVCGHTHVQFDRTVDEIRVVNAGSVGMPYEDEPGAYWALLGPDVDLRRTEYDVDRALAEIAATGFPEEWPRASRDEATEFFEKVARGET